MVPAALLAANAGGSLPGMDALGGGGGSEQSSASSTSSLSGGNVSFGNFGGPSGAEKYLPWVMAGVAVIGLIYTMRGRK